MSGLKAKLEYRGSKPERKPPFARRLLRKSDKAFLLMFAVLVAFFASVFWRSPGFQEIWRQLTR